MVVGRRWVRSSRRSVRLFHWWSPVGPPDGAGGHAAVGRESCRAGNVDELDAKGGGAGRPCGRRPDAGQLSDCRRGLEMLGLKRQCLEQPKLPTLGQGENVLQKSRSADGSRHRNDRSRARLRVRRRAVRSTPARADGRADRCRPPWPGSRPDASAGGGGVGNCGDVGLDALHRLLRNERPDPPQALSGRGGLLGSRTRPWGVTSGFTPRVRTVDHAAEDRLTPDPAVNRLGDRRFRARQTRHARRDERVFAGAHQHRPAVARYGRLKKTRSRSSRLASMDDPSAR